MIGMGPTAMRDMGLSCQHSVDEWELQPGISESEWVENYYYERSGVRAILAKLTSQDSLLKTGQGDWMSLRVGVGSGGGR